MEQEWTMLQPVFTSVVAIVVVLLFAATRRSKRHWPPGPTPWPVVGNMPHLSSLPHQDLLELSKKYGKLMSIKIGSVDYLVASSPELAEEFLKTQDKVWASRHPSTNAKILTYGGLDFGLSEYGPWWRFGRKVYATELFSHKRLAGWQRPRKQEIMTTINETIRACSQGTKAVRMDTAARKIATNIITRQLLNRSLLNEENHQYTIVKDVDDFQDLVKQFFKLFGTYYLGDYIPWMSRFDPQGVKMQMYAIAKKFDVFSQSVIDDHKLKLEATKHLRQRTTDDRPQDIVDILLTRPTDDDGRKFSETEVKVVIQNVIIAGTDTNAATLQWALSELLKHPHVLEKAQAEMDAVVGRDRLVEEYDLPNLPYLDAIVKENFRLHLPGPMLAPHMSMEDCEIQGYKIPAGTRLYINAYAIQRDPAVYDRPLEFCPERFLGSTKDMNGLDFDLLPFGGGRRICPGKGQALMVIPYTLALFIQTCNWRLPGNMKPEELDMEEVFESTLFRRNPLVAIATSRLSEHVILDGLN